MTKAAAAEATSGGTTRPAPNRWFAESLPKACRTRRSRAILRRALKGAEGDVINAWLVIGCAVPNQTRYSSYNFMRLAVATAGLYAKHVAEHHQPGDDRASMGDLLGRLSRAGGDAQNPAGKELHYLLRSADQSETVRRADRILGLANARLGQRKGAATLDWGQALSDLWDLSSGDAERRERLALRWARHYLPPPKKADQDPIIQSSRPSGDDSDPTHPPEGKSP